MAEEDINQYNEKQNKIKIKWQTNRVFTCFKLEVPNPEYEDNMSSWTSDHFSLTRETARGSK